MCVEPVVPRAVGLVLLQAVLAGGSENTGSFIPLVYSAQGFGADEALTAVFFLLQLLCGFLQASQPSWAHCMCQPLPLS